MIFVCVFGPAHARVCSIISLWPLLTLCLFVLCVFGPVHCKRVLLYHCSHCQLSVVCYLCCVVCLGLCMQVCLPLYHCGHCQVIVCFVLLFVLCCCICKCLVLLEC